MAYKDIVITMVLVGLVAFGLIGFAIGFGNLNDTEVNLGDNEIFSNFNESISQNLVETTEKANSSRVNFESENPETGFGEIIFSSIVGVGKLLTIGIFGYLDAFFTIISSVIFGNDKSFAVFIGGITSIIIITIVFLLWRAYKTGE